MGEGDKGLIKRKICVTFVSNPNHIWEPEQFKQEIKVKSKSVLSLLLVLCLFSAEGKADNYTTVLREIGWEEGKWSDPVVLTAPADEHGEVWFAVTAPRPRKMTRMHARGADVYASESPNSGHILPNTYESVVLRSVGSRLEWKPVSFDEVLRIKEAVAQERYAYELERGRSFFDGEEKKAGVIHYRFVVEGGTTLFAKERFVETPPLDEAIQVHEISDNLVTWEREFDPAATEDRMRVLTKDGHQRMLKWGVKKHSRPLVFRFASEKAVTAVSSRGDGPIIEHRTGLSRFDSVGTTSSMMLHAQHFGVLPPQGATVVLSPVDDTDHPAITWRLATDEEIALAQSEKTRG